MKEIIIAVITGSLALLGVVISSLINARATTRKIENKIITSEQIIDNLFNDIERIIIKGNSVKKLCHRITV